MEASGYQGASLRSHTIHLLHSGRFCHAVTWRWTIVSCGFFILLGSIVLPTEVDVDLLMLCKLSLQVCLVLDCLFLLYGSLKLQQIPSCVAQGQLWMGTAECLVTSRAVILNL